MSILSLPLIHQAEKKAKASNMNPKEALRQAQETDEVDATIEAVLESELDRIWARIQAQSSSYIMDQTEFGIFNRYRSQSRFQNETVRTAVERYWNSRSVANNHWFVASYVRRDIYRTRAYSP